MSRNDVVDYMNMVARDLSPRKPKRECVFQSCRNKPVVFKRVFDDANLPKKWHCKKHSEVM